MTTLSNFKNTNVPLGMIPQPSLNSCENYTEHFENVCATCTPFRIEEEVLPQIDPNNKFLNPEKRNQREFTHRAIIFHGYTPQTFSSARDEQITLRKQTV